MLTFKTQTYHTLFVFFCIFATVLNAHPSFSVQDDNPSRKYSIFNYPSSLPGGQTLLTGICGVRGKPDEVYITGFYNSSDGVAVIPFLYKGPLSGKGSWNILNFPSTPGRTVTATHLYGPNNSIKANVQVVGNYTTVENGLMEIGCLYEGPVDGTGKWTTVIPLSSEPVIASTAHSSMGDLVVGNYYTQELVSRAFIYDIKSQRYDEIIKPNAKDIAAYGIWHNGGYSYTICGGYSDLSTRSAYLVDWNNRTRRFSNWRTYDYGNERLEDSITHFDGITSNKRGGYYLTGDWSDIHHLVEQGFFCEINKDHAVWTSISYPGQTLTSGNSVHKKAVIGSYLSLDDFSVNGYISTPKRKKRR